MRRGENHTDFQDFSGLLRRRWWIVGITTVAALAVAALVSTALPPRYKATSMVRVAVVADPAIFPVDYRYSVRSMNTYAFAAQSSPVLEEAIALLETGLTAEQLKDYVEAEAIPDTELLRITATHPTPEVARNIANAVASVLVIDGQDVFFGTDNTQSEILAEQVSLAKADLDEAVREFSTLDPESVDPARVDVARRQMEARQQIYGIVLGQLRQSSISEELRANAITLVQPASLPVDPSWPRTNLNLIVGGIIGFMGGVALAVLVDGSDPRLHTVRQIESATDLKILAAIPKKKSYRGNRMNIKTEMQQLTAYVVSLVKKEWVKVLLVSGIDDGGDAPRIATRLATSTAKGGIKTLIVGADHYSSMPQRSGSFIVGAGFTELLVGSVKVEDVLYKTKTMNLWGLKGGQSWVSGSDILISPQATELMAVLGQQFDIVFMLSPPKASEADALVLASQVDSVILVVRCGTTRRDNLHAALRQLQNVEVVPAGIVITHSA